MTQLLGPRQVPQDNRVDRRLENLERRSLTKQTGLSPLPLASGQRAVTQVVAASNALDFEKEGADFICPGTSADFDVIRDALDAAYNSPITAYGHVRLTTGYFYGDSNPLYLLSGTMLSGSGKYSTDLIVPSSAAAAIQLGPRATIRDIGIDGPGATTSRDGIKALSGACYVDEMMVYGFHQGMIVAPTGFGVTDDQVHIRASGFANCRQALRIVQGVYNISECEFRSAGTPDSDTYPTILIDGGRGSIEFCEIEFDGDTAETVLYNGIHVITSAQHKFIGNALLATGGAGGNAGFSMIAVNGLSAGNNARRILITNNSFYDNGTYDYAVALDANTDTCLVADNIFDGVGSIAQTNDLGTGNSIVDNL